MSIDRRRLTNFWSAFSPPCLFLICYLQQLLPTSKPARDALMATIVLALITIALEAVLLHRHKAMTASLTGSSTTGSSGGGGMSYEISFFRPLTVYYSIFILAEVFAVGLLWDAVSKPFCLVFGQLSTFTLCSSPPFFFSFLTTPSHTQNIGDSQELVTTGGVHTLRMVHGLLLGTPDLATRPVG